MGPKHYAIISAFIFVTVLAVVLGLQEDTEVYEEQIPELEEAKVNPIEKPIESKIDYPKLTINPKDVRPDLLKIFENMDCDGLSQYLRDHNTNSLDAQYDLDMTEKEIRHSELLWIACITKDISSMSQEDFERAWNSP